MNKCYFKVEAKISALVYVVVNKFLHLIDYIFT